MGERTGQLGDYDRSPYEAGGYLPSDDPTDDTVIEETVIEEDDFPLASNTEARDDDISEAVSEQEAESTDDPSQIRDNIEETRAEMSQTIDEIQERLSPQHLVNQATDKVREATLGRAEDMVSDMTDTAKSAGQGFWTTIRENPIPSALVGLGLGWLLYKSRDNMPSGNQRFNGGYSAYEPPYRGQAYGARNRDAYYRPAYQAHQPGLTDRPQDKGRNIADQAQHLASQTTDNVRQAASQAQDTASQLADQAQDTASQLADQAQYQAQRAQGWIQRSWDENPLAMGALALAAGMVIGLAIPETEPENQLMGATRDSLMQKAQESTQDTVQKVQAVAQQATDAAKDAAKREAENQGLTQTTTP